MTKMRGPDCVVMYNLINTHSNRQTYDIQVGRQTDRQTDRQTHTNTHTHTYTTRKRGGEHKMLRAQVRFVQVERVCPLCRV